jgi:CRISPR/Cas system-associated exonuclease Cas4 (RecB family)
VVPALFFVQRSSQDNYNPILELSNQPIEDIGALRSDFEEHLSEVINEIFNPQMPFCPTTVNSRCATCPFKPLCKS